jgi:predicted sulfurtransferase
MSDINKTATLAAGEQERIDKALDVLAENNHAPREITVKYILHVNHEFPKLMYKGKKETRTVNNEAEEKAATADGFGAYVHPKPVEE